MTQEKTPMELVMDYMQKRIEQIDEARKMFRAKYPNIYPQTDNDLQLVVDAIKNGTNKIKEFNERIDKQYPNSICKK